MNELLIAVLGANTLKSMEAGELHSSAKVWALVVKIIF